MLRLILVLLLVTACAPAEAPAAPVSRTTPPLEISEADVTPTTASDLNCGHTRVGNALETAPVELPEGWEVQVQCDRSEISGQVQYPDKVILLWPARLNADQIRGTFTHEVAHVLDFTTMGKPAHDLWRYARNLEGDWWREEPAPAEDFAESFAYCVTPDPDPWYFEQELGTEPPTRAECALAVSLLLDARGVDVRLLDR